MSRLARTTNLELSPAVFSILSQLIEEKMGLHYGLLDRQILQEKASHRAHEAGFDSLLDYYYFLRYDEGAENELHQLAEALVVNETYFFREWPAIESLVSSVIEPLCAAGMRPRIWSAACSTGEEPLSLAMLLDSKGLLNQVDLVASDISAKVLAKPLIGVYGSRSVRQIPAPALSTRYLQTLGSDYRVPMNLVNHITWKKINLLDAESIGKLGKFDAILCRNVLIYFADPTINTILKSFEKALLPEGVLLVGVSESLLRYGSNFVGEEKAGAFLYRKGDPL